MEIEWVTICQEFREREEGEDWFIDLLGVIRDSVAIYAPLPQTVEVELAVVLRATHEELGDGGVMTLLYVAIDPEDQMIYQGTAQYAMPPSPDLYVDRPRRAVIPFTATVPVAREGLYRLAVGLAPNDPPYVVDCQMILFPTVADASE